MGSMQAHVLPASESVAPAAARRWQVVCLCAEWCGVCRQYRSDFDRLAFRFPEITFSWVDVEDEADVAGDVDIETFPSVVIADGEGVVRFAGPLTPQPEVLARLIVNSQSVPPPNDARAAADAAGDFTSMIARIRHRSDRS
jgi:thioredoxin-like negative regulator of GroEL